jgi:hypothetical protein
MTKTSPRATSEQGFASTSLHGAGLSSTPADGDVLLPVKYYSRIARIRSATELNNPAELFGGRLQVHSRFAPYKCYPYF